MKTKIFSIIVLTVFMSMTGLAAAHAAGKTVRGMVYKDRKAGWEEKMKSIHKELGLSPQQEAALKTNRETSRERMRNMHEEIHNKMEEIRQELQKPDFDMARVKKLHNELKTLKNEEEDNRLESILAVRGILTAEQFAKFMEIKEQHKTKRKMMKIRR